MKGCRAVALVLGLVVLGALGVLATSTDRADQPSATPTADRLSAGDPSTTAPEASVHRTPTRRGQEVDPPPSRASSPARLPGPRQGDGTLVRVGGSAPPQTPTQAPHLSYVVEVEGGLPVVGAKVAAQVEMVLGDPRSWGGDGSPPLVRVGDGPTDLRVVLASPALTDRMCAPLKTVGRFSCGSGGVAVLNADRWLTGAPAYGQDLAGYRTYLISHEVGHLLGHRHEACPAAGAPAPVMMQQTKGVGACVAQPWPFPAAGEQPAPVRP